MATMNSNTGLCRVIASEMGRRHKGVIYLDNGVPIDIYELFEQVTGRDYNPESHNDELLILEIADAYENGEA